MNKQERKFDKIILGKNRHISKKYYWQNHTHTYKYIASRQITLSLLLMLNDAAYLRAIYLILF